MKRFSDLSPLCKHEIRHIPAQRISARIYHAIKPSKTVSKWHDTTYPPYTPFAFRVSTLRRLPGGLVLLRRCGEWLCLNGYRDRERQSQPTAQRKRVYLVNVLASHAWLARLRGETLAKRLVTEIHPASQGE